MRVADKWRVRGLCAWLLVREPLRFGRDAWRDAERARERDGRRKARREYPLPYYFVRSGMSALPHPS